jgi:Fungal specific transcription factor domain
VCLDSGESLSTGLVAVSLAITCATSLGLHLEPSTESSLSTLEKENRRKLLWTVFTLDLQASSALGRPSGLWNFDSIETKLPGNYADEDYDENGQLFPEREHPDEARETVMTSIILQIKISQLTKRMVGQRFLFNVSSLSVVLMWSRTG